MDIRTWIRFLLDVRYASVVSPYGLDHSKMTPKEAQANFAWYLEQIPQRMQYFRHRCARDLRVPPSLLDYSPESLLPVWRWFLKKARLEKRSKEELKAMEEGAKIFGESWIVRKKLSPATMLMLLDVAMYVGECFVRAHESLYWDYVKKPKREVRIHQPAVFGFPDGSFFAPIHMVHVQAVKLYDGEASDRDLYKVFCFWMKELTQSSADKTDESQ